MSTFSDIRFKIRIQICLHSFNSFFKIIRVIDSHFNLSKEVMKIMLTRTNQFVKIKYALRVMVLSRIMISRWEFSVTCPVAGTPLL